MDKTQILTCSFLFPTKDGEVEDKEEKEYLGSRRAWDPGSRKRDYSEASGGRMGACG